MRQYQALRDWRFFWLAWAALAFCLAGGTTWAAEPVTDPEYLIDSWHSEDGLPQNSITSLVQMGDGYMWLGTFNGLVRFDGAHFKIFDAANTPALQSSRISRLARDSQGRLWIMTVENDITVLDRGQFTHVGTNYGAPTEKMSLLGLDPDGHLWLRSAPEAGFLAIQAGQFLPMIPAPPEAATNLSQLVANNLGILWWGVPGKWRILDFLQNRAISRNLYGGNIGYEDVAGGADGSLWVDDKQTLRQLRDGKWVRIVPHPDGFTCSAMIEDHLGNVWKGTWGAGLQRFGRDGSVRRFNLSGSPQPEPIRTLYEDRAGAIWVGLDGGGLCRLRRRIFRTYGVAQGLHGHVARGVVEDSAGTFWILNQGFIDWLRPAAASPVEPSPWAGESAWCALPSTNETVWVAARGSNVFRVSRQGRELLTNAGPDRISETSVLFTDRAGGLWLGAGNGIWQFQDGRLQPVAPPPGMVSPDVRSMAEDRSGRLYFGLNGGGLLQRQGANWTQFESSEALASRRIWALHVDPEDTLWLGSYGGGLARFRDGKIFHFRDRHLGLPDAVTCIIEDDEGYLWCGSTHGIFRVSRKELNEYADGRRKRLGTVQFGRADGLETSECSSGAQPLAWKARDGRLWFCMVHGIAAVMPREVTLHPLPPPVVIEEVHADDQVYSEFQPNLPQAAGNWLERLRIPAGTARIEIGFNAFTYLDPSKTRYEYRLQGYDKDWVDGGALRTATYTHIPPGAYRFQVTAGHSDGLWNETGAEFSLIVLPRYYQTWWFQALLAITLVALVALVYRFRVRQIQEVSRLRLRIAGDLHDEVGSNLGSIALNSELLQSSPTLPAEIRGELAEINRVAVQTTQTIREITWLINPGFDSLSEMVERMHAVADAMLAGRQFEFQSSPPYSARKLSLEFRRHVFLAYKEILHNIVKHSGARRVVISVQERAGVLELLIYDQGRGFDESAVRHGHGLTSLRRRAAALGGTLQINSRPGSGTTVALRVPVK